MNPFLDRVLGDLQSFCNDLVTPGLDRASPKIRHVGGGIAGVLAAVETFAQLTPTLLSEADGMEREGFEQQLTRVPARARVTRRPGDYAQSPSGSIVPVRWMRSTPVVEPDPRALAWLLHLCAKLGEKLEFASDRHERMFDKVRAARRGGELWYREERPALAARSRSLQRARTSLQQAEQAVRRYGAPSLRASGRAPRPFPSSPAWRYLRRNLQTILDPAASPRRFAAALFGAGEAADLPFLYQRWCGLKLIEAIEEAGFERLEDPMESLLMGGRVAFRDAGQCRIELWIEARMLAGQRHPSGLTCVEGTSATPDFVIVTPGPQGQDSFVVDATMATSADEVELKGSYADRIASYDLSLVAGIPAAQRTPLRAWAMAPYVAPHCRLLGRGDRTGRYGIIPMHPVSWNAAPLAAFLDDLLRHGRTWWDALQSN